MQSAWAQKFEKVYHVPLIKKKSSFSYASFRTGKTFRQPKVFGTVNFKHGRPLQHGKGPLEQRVTSQNASIFQNLRSRSTNFQRSLRKQHVVQKTPENSLANSFSSLFCYGLRIHCTDASRMLRDTGFWIFFFSSFHEPCKGKRKLSLQLSTKRSKSSAIDQLRCFSCFNHHPILLDYSVSLGPEN